MTDSIDGHFSLPFDILMAQDGHHLRQPGVLLIANLLNAYFSGLVTQQFYLYWASGFKDPLRLRLFVVVEFLLVAFQNILMWDIAFEVYVVFHVNPSSTPRVKLWAGPINALCQLFIILLANVYLADRIHGLTKSRVQSGIVFALSIIAFVFGLANVVGVWERAMSPSFEKATSVIWHTIQAIAECLITFFLARVLLKSRNGVRVSGSVVNYIVRNVIQTGFLATISAIIAAVTWFLLPNVSVYRIFDITSGTLYTHAIFDTLLSRLQLRAQMTSTYVDLTLPSQQPQDGRRHLPNILHSSSSFAKRSKMTPAPFGGSEPESSVVNENNTMELKDAGIPDDGLYESSHDPHQKQRGELSIRWDGTGE